ncbi:MAG: response regulator [Candidatus Competibacteraceae bacterium]|jgi:CheY-like chemotaxis protein|nr:response regulator [Candidatus Competibacteraceae bacterium]
MTDSADTTDSAALRVLVVEDNPGDLLLLKEMLKDAGEEDNPFVPPFYLQEAPDKQAASQCLQQETFDIILLDLNLPDSQGLATFTDLRDQLSDVAVVVLTGLVDNTLAMEAIRHGAQDYLVKNKLDHDLLVRSMRYAVERQRMQNELEQIRQRQYRLQEILSLEELSRTGLDQRDSVQKLLRDYTLLVQRHVRATRLQEPRPAEDVRMLARQLARLHARARDVVHLHLRVLENTGSWSKSAEERAFANDARLVLLELMGNLIDIYLEWTALR